MTLPTPREIKLAELIMSFGFQSQKAEPILKIAREILGNDPADRLVIQYRVDEIMRYYKEQDMPRLEDLRKSLLDMSPDELRAKIAEIREDRRIRKDKPKDKKAKVERKSSTQNLLAELVAGMSDEEREAFFKELEA